MDGFRAARARCAGATSEYADRLSNAAPTAQTMGRRVIRGLWSMCPHRKMSISEYPRGKTRKLYRCAPRGVKSSQTVFRRPAIARGAPQVEVAQGSFLKPCGFFRRSRSESKTFRKSAAGSLLKPCGSFDPSRIQFETLPENAQGQRRTLRYVAPVVPGVE